MKKSIIFNPLFFLKNSVIELIEKAKKQTKQNMTNIENFVHGNLKLSSKIEEQLRMNEKILYKGK